MLTRRHACGELDREMAQIDAQRQQWPGSPPTSPRVELSGELLRRDLPGREGAFHIAGKFRRVLARAEPHAALGLLQDWLESRENVGLHDRVGSTADVAVADPVV